LDLRPEARSHLVEPLKLQIAKLLGLLDGLLTERGEFGTDIGVRRVHIHGELSGDVAVRAAGLPQFESNRPALGDGLDLVITLPYSDCL
jgi:hypothetical protein